MVQYSAQKHIPAASPSKTLRSWTSTPPGSDHGHDQRRWLRAEYHVDAVLEVVGRTMRGGGIAVQVQDVSERGMGFRCSEPLSEGLDVRITMPAPDGIILHISGTLMRAIPLEPDGFHLGLHFDRKQPLLSAMRIPMLF